MLRLAIFSIVLAATLAGPASTTWAGQPCTHCGHPRAGYSGRAHYSGRTDRNGLPGGRTYYNGHYYGNFNNRFYGPQYGYF